MITLDGVVMVDVREAADLVHRTPETVRRWVWTKRIGAVKHGNKLLLRRDVVLELAAPGSASQGSPSLRGWADRVRESSVGGEPGSSAADLVLADRAARGVGEDTNDAGR